MDPDLADIVLVKQEEMKQWQEKQQKLIADKDATSRRVNAKLAEYKKGYAEQFAISERQKEQDFRDLEQRYQDLQNQKDFQERQNAGAMGKIEKYHYAEVKEIQDLFEEKLKKEGNSYLQLEQEGLEMRQRFQSQI